MRPYYSIHRFRLHALFVREELSSVCAACRALDIHRFTCTQPPAGASSGVPASRAV